MQTISIQHQYQPDYNTIWNNASFLETEFRDLHDRGYALQDIVTKNSILFIGLNPSFNALRNEPHKMFYDLKPDNLGSYFHKFPKLVPAGCQWSHIDLFGIRETNQKRLQLFIDLRIDQKFILDQLELAKEIIVATAPKILVVTNTLARSLFGLDNLGNNTGRWLNFQFEFDNEIGTYRIVNHAELNRLPVFFTGMLTGQRALDLGSFKRLAWHIDFVTQKLKEEVCE